MAELNLTITLDDAALKALPGKLALDAAVLVAGTAEAVRAEASRRAPANKRPTVNIADEDRPRLKDALKVQATDPLSADVVDTSGIGQFVEDNTKPHDIRPVAAGVLHWEDAGQDIFAMQVHHPGTKAQPFLGPATDAMRPAWERGLEALFAPGGRL